jgi:hypothetical protein
MDAELPDPIAHTLMAPAPVKKNGDGVLTIGAAYENISGTFYANLSKLID